MNKTELAAVVAESLEVSAAKGLEAVNAVIDAISGVLVEGGDVNIAGFGKFETVTTAPRTGRNPSTGEPVDIPAKTAVKFRPGKTLKEQVN